MDIKMYSKKRAVIWGVLAIIIIVSFMVLYSLVHTGKVITYNKFFVGIISIAAIILGIASLLRELIFTIEYIAYRKDKYIIKEGKTNKMFIRKIKNTDKKMGYTSKF